VQMQGFHPTVRGSAAQRGTAQPTGHRSRPRRQLNSRPSADTKLGALRARVSSRRRFVLSAGGRAWAGGLGLGLGRQAASAGVMVMTQPGLSFWSWRIR
jgi:hypothetical protein